MTYRENWIWLPEDRYPERQKSNTSRVLPADERKGFTYTVASFERGYGFGREIDRVTLEVCADTAFRLYICGGKKTVYGPASITSDFLSRYGEGLPAYYTTVTFDAKTDPDLSESFAAGRLDFASQVRMVPEREFEMSMGRGGFCMGAEVLFADGSAAYIGTDETWNCRLLPEYAEAGIYDDSVPEEPIVKAQRVRNIWHPEKSPIPPCTVVPAVPEGVGDGIVLESGKVFDGEFEFPAVIAGYVSVEAHAEGDGARLCVTVECAEDDEKGSTESCTFTKKDGYFQSFGLHSAGKLRIHAENTGKTDVSFRPFLSESYYPITGACPTVTSDGDLNAVLRACENNLKYCRQTLHLDSARHCEPLACTGDYYIESLMTAMSFGDMRLAAFDVRRTSRMLEYRNGRMFHTTYSLIWVQMLRDVYMITGDTDLLTESIPALTMLLDRFHGYLGANGLIETPPDYMFVDWLNPDGLSMHHPPKALGQTCLCMFYFGALKSAADIYGICGLDVMANRCLRRADELREAMLDNLYDAERGLFFEGLNTKTPENMLYRYMPQNVDRRYYRRHANILAVYSGVFPEEKSRELLRKLTDDASLGEVQPYFMHFWLEAVYRTGLREEYTMKLLDMWKPSVLAFPKGIAEGFYKPEPTYRFDHSHAWGGTPLYSLPLALSGLKIIKAGYREIELHPCLCGLEHATVGIPMRSGKAVIVMEKGKTPAVTLPAGVVLNNPDILSEVL